MPLIIVNANKNIPKVCLEKLKNKNDDQEEMEDAVKKVTDFI